MNDVAMAATTRPANAVGELLRLPVGCERSDQYVAVGWIVPKSAGGLALQWDKDAKTKEVHALRLIEDGVQARLDFLPFKTADIVVQHGRVYVDCSMRCLIAHFRDDGKSALPIETNLELQWARDDGQGRDRLWMQARALVRLPNTYAVTEFHTLTGWEAGSVFDQAVAAPRGFAVLFKPKRMLRLALSSRGAGERTAEWSLELDPKSMLPGLGTFEDWKAASLRERRREVAAGVAAPALSAMVIEAIQIRTPQVASWWNETVAVPLQTSLRTVRRSRAVSGVCQLVDPAAGGRWSVRYDLDDRAWNQPGYGEYALARCREGGDQPRITSSKAVSTSVYSVALRCHEEVRVTAQYDGLRTLDGAPVRVRGTVGPLGVPTATNRCHEADQASARSCSNAEFAFRADTPPAAGELRIGSLDLALGSFLGSDALGRCDYKAVLGESGLAGFESVTHLPIERAAPGSQDPVSRETRVDENVGICDPDTDDDGIRSPPLVIPLPDREPPRKPGDVQPRMILRVRERIRRAADHTLDVELLRVPAAEGHDAFVREAIVLDDAPFLLASVRQAPTVARLEEEDIEVRAVYSDLEAEGAAWQLVGGARGYELGLPPQGVGEAMERFPQGEAAKEGSRWLDIAPGEPADFRFTPFASLRLSSSYHVRRYTEAPWNLRRVLGYPGQREPGAGVWRLDFESFYGLACTVENPKLSRVDRAAGIVFDTRIAELGSLVGRLAARRGEELAWGRGADTLAASEPAFLQEARCRHRHERKSWEAHRAAHLHRLGVLELWRPGQEGPVRLDRDVRYELRRSARLKWPIPGVEPRGPLFEHVPHDEDGLAGGVAWPFESANIWRALWRDTKSTSASLAGLRFSALGGWANQRAGFDRDRSAIEVDVSMGRAHRVTVERIGRIACFWNRAKHVITYVRSVAPSLQFGGSQDEHLRRPVLRKFEEYVQILEDTRTYPDVAGAPADAAFIKACRFSAGQRIPVDGRWGRDLGEHEWVIPLWSRTADPRVYPRPCVHLTGAGAEAETPLQLADPSELRFYTTTHPDLDARTDLWPSAPEVDFVDQAPPAPEQVASLAEDDPDRVLADAPPVPAGYGPCSFSLVPALRGVDLLSGRAEKAMEAIVSTVTVQRASQLAEKALEGPLAEATKAARVAQDALETVSSEAQGMVQQVLDHLTGPVRDAEAARALLSSGLEGLLKPLCKRVQDAAGVLKDYKPGGPKDPFVLLRESAIAEIRRAVTRIEGLLVGKGGLRPTLDQMVEELSQRAAYARDVVQESIDAECDRIGSLPRALSDGLGAVREAIASVQFRVEEARTAVVARISEARRRLVEAVSLAAARHHEARAAAASLLRDAHSAARHALDTVEGLVARKARGVVETLLATLRGELTQLREKLHTAHEAAQQAVGDPAAAAALWERLARATLQAWEDATTTFAKRLEKDVQAASKALLELSDKASAPILALLACLSPTALRERFKLSADVGDWSGLRAKIGVVVEGLLAEVRRAGEALVGVVESEFGALSNALKDIVGGGAEAALQALADLGCEDHGLLARIKELLESPAKDLEAARHAIEGLAGEVRGRIDEYAGHLRDKIRSAVPEPVMQARDRALRLVRAFGDAPLADGMSFTRNRIGYYFQDALTQAGNAVRTTPVAALVNRVGSELKGLGIRLPASGLSDGKLLAEDLGKQLLSKILPDLGGLRGVLDKVFPGVRMPSTDGVVVRHGLDPDSRRPWVESEITIDKPGSTPLISIEVVKVLVRDAKIRAHLKLDVRPDGGVRQSSEGSVTGDWEIHVAGIHVMTFVETSLRVSLDRGLQMDVRPERVRMPGVMKFLSDLLGGGGGGGGKEGEPGVRRIDRDGIPVGAEAVLALALPDISVGVFGITGLRLDAHFRLLVLPRFVIDAGLGVGSREAPFRLNIAFLGGGGWFVTRTSYEPFGGDLTTELSIGITAGVGFTLKLGPIGGSVWFFFAIEVNLRATAGKRSSAAVILRLGFTGEVQVLFLSAGLGVLLEAEYSAGTLTGRGIVYIKVKIFWCFTFEFRAKTEQRLAGGGGGQEEGVLQSFEGTNPWEPRVKEYLAMFEGAV